MGSAGYGRLDLPPSAGSRASLPRDLGRRFLLFVDAEEEFDWSRPPSREAIATTAIAALPEANLRFVDRGVVPTYLLDYPVVADPESASTIAAMALSGACEFGAQLHPWVTPPFEETVTPANSFAGNLPAELEEAKLRALTERIALVTGQQPRVYRAGRYGVGPRTAAILARAGYRLDVSVRSRFSYRVEGGPDFSRHPVWPWWVRSDLLELPLTAGYTGPLRAWPGLHRNAGLRRLFARGGLLSRVALTPEGMPLRAVLSVLDRLAEEGLALFSLSFHTPSLVPGHTPYVRDACDLAAFWRWWDGVFAWFDRNGVEPLRASELIEAAEPGRPR